MSRSFSGIAAGLALGLFSVALTLVIAEWVLRATILPVESVDPFAQVALVADPVIGYRLQPNQRTIMTNGHFFAEIRTDEAGLRDLYDERYPNPGIIAIGDSQTFGHGVRVEATWVERLQANLGMNVVNTGVFGYGVSQYEHVLRRVHDAGQPIRLVLYAMSWNDVESGTFPPDLLVVEDGFLVRNPAYSRAGDGEQSLQERVMRSRFARTFVNRTALGKLLRLAGNSLLGRFGVAVHGMDERLVRSSEQTKQKLLALNDLLESLGARLVVVHIGNANLVMPDLWKDYQRRYRHSRFFAREAFADWAEGHGIVFEDAILALEARYLESGMERTSVILPVDAHYGAGGHDVIAAVFAKTLRERGLDEQPPQRDSRAGIE